MGKFSLKNGHETNMIIIYSMGILLHLNEMKEQILGNGINEDVVDAKIMHQCINVL